MRMTMTAFELKDLTAQDLRVIMAGLAELKLGGALETFAKVDAQVKAYMQAAQGPGGEELGEGKEPELSVVGGAASSEDQGE